MRGAVFESSHCAAEMEAMARAGNEGTDFEATAVRGHPLSTADLATWKAGETVYCIVYTGFTTHF